MRMRLRTRAPNERSTQRTSDGSPGPLLLLLLLLIIIILSTVIVMIVRGAHPIPAANAELVVLLSRTRMI